MEDEKMIIRYGNYKLSDELILQRNNTDIMRSTISALHIKARHYNKPTDKKQKFVYVDTDGLIFDTVIMSCDGKRETLQIML
jgi:hypothetical protein